MCPYVCLCLCDPSPSPPGILATAARSEPHRPYLCPSHRAVLIVLKDNANPDSITVAPIRCGLGTVCCLCPYFSSPPPPILSLFLLSACWSVRPPALIRVGLSASLRCSTASIRPSLASLTLTALDQCQNRVLLWLPPLRVVSFRTGEKGRQRTAATFPRSGAEQRQTECAVQRNRWPLSQYRPSGSMELVHG